VPSISYTPAEAVTIALASIENRRTTQGVGVRTGVASIDNELQPARPGEFIGVIGRTSHYKSGLMQWWARTESQRLLTTEADDQCVVYVTWEQAIEEMVCFDLAHTARIPAADVAQGRITDEQMEQLRLVHGPTRAAVPLYLVGHSIREQKTRPHLTLSAVGQSLLRFRNDFGVAPRAIFLDYLQQMEPEEGQDRQTQVFHNVGRCKDMALAMGCPVIVSSQAKRESYDNRKWGVPGITDSQWSSNFEHTCDKALGVWYPCKEQEAPVVKGPDGQVLPVTPHLLIVQLLKQRLGPSGKVWALYVDPERNEIGAMTTERMVWA
jgi:replicative DNA helicase